jgi:hypothetical protein
MPQSYLTTSWVLRFATATLKIEQDRSWRADQVEDVCAEDESHDS